MTNLPSYYWLNEESRGFLKNGYLTEGQTAEQRIKVIANRAEEILKIKGFADKFESYMSKGFFSLSSPIWSNFGVGRGLPISCYGSFISDTIESILLKTAEVGMMTKFGGGTSGYFGSLRPRGTPISVGGTSSGPVHFLEIFDKTTTVISQSNVRRGNFAAYLDIDHKDIKEFLGIRELGHPIQNISIGVCISDKWMESMIGGDKKKRELWALIIKKRFETGYPYLFFTDTVNKNAPQVYKDKGMVINGSNLCIEICLAYSPEESFVCDLSSLNLLHWEEIKTTDAIETLTYFLDAVMEEFIEKTKDIPLMKAAHTFAVNQRALGVGVLGWHSLLQSRNIPFESMEAKYLNGEIFETIRDRTEAASKKMALEYGEPPLLKGYGLRNVTRQAVAPTTSSSFILGQVSQSIEPFDSNIYVRNLAKGNYTFKNPYLKAVLAKYDKDNPKVWKDILTHGGSVQHLKFLSDHEKQVFKTFGEISQKEIVIQAIQRQKYIDQSISLNLMIHGDCPNKQVSDLLIYGWQHGIKTFYYQRGFSGTQSLTRDILNCESCEA